MCSSAALSRFTADEYQRPLDRRVGDGMPRTVWQQINFAGMVPGRFASLDERVPGRTTAQCLGHARGR